ncbi:MAG TPA: hypothetical protein VH088_22275 [Terriglobales bacterium]|nr:hypothetical protein [Terriglobales bacterium]
MSESAQNEKRRFFLISPANIAGIRGRRLIAENANSELAKRLRAGGVPLGELYSFISSLYFRGKLAYASAFGNVDASFVITGCGGLVPPSTNVSLPELQKLTAVDFDPTDSRYRGPLDRDLRGLLEMAPDCEVVLLGSIATPKYVDPVLEIFGERLLFPEEFIGRGDMSRGGLMLRSIESGVELAYVALCKANRHGRKPPKLAPIPRNKI